MHHWSEQNAVMFDAECQAIQPMYIRCRWLSEMIPFSGEVLRDPGGIGGWGSEKTAAQPSCLMKTQSLIAPEAEGTCKNCQVIIKYSVLKWYYIFHLFLKWDRIGCKWISEGLSGCHCGIEKAEMKNAFVINKIEIPWESVCVCLTSEHECTCFLSE